MEDEAAQAAGCGTDDGRALGALRWDWGDAYRIGRDEARGWWAQRRDGPGSDITAETPDGLEAAVTADYRRRPVPRDLPGHAGTGVTRQ